MTNGGSIFDMAQRREAWLNEKPQSNSSQLRGLMGGDEVFFWFGSNGDDGDRLFKVYRAHSIPTIVNGQKQSTTRYCLKQNDGQECPYCDQGLTDMKERMAFWMYIQDHLHLQLDQRMPQERRAGMSQVQYQGQYVFHEKVNDWRLWDTSAWRDSPWADILKFAEMYKGLHNFLCQMSVTGEKLQRRYKMYAMPNSPVMPNDLYQKAMQELEPVRDFLVKQLATPVQVAPQQQPQGQNNVTQPVAAWSPTPNSAAAFSPFGGGSGTGNQATAPSNPAPAATFNPFSAPTAPAPQEQQAPSEAAPVSEAPNSTNEIPWENNDDNVPLKGMF